MAVGKIDIQDGANGGLGGATAPRCIMVDDHIREALRYAEQVSPDHSRNLLAPNESYFDFQQGIVRPPETSSISTTSKASTHYGPPIACERYEQITRHSAPINGGNCYPLDHHLDQKAQAQISYE